MKVYSVRLIHPHAENFPRSSYYATKEELSKNHSERPWIQIAINEWLIVTPFSERGPSLIYLIQEIEVWG